MDVEKIRLETTVQDLVDLGVENYCDLGSGYGAVPIGLKNAGKNVTFIESEWNQYILKDWADGEFDYKIKDFLLDDINVFDHEIQCFSLVHCVAHFHLPPQILFEKIYEILPEGGYFYLSTVNGSSLSRVMKLFRGQPITGKVTKHPQPGNTSNVYLSRMLGLEHHMTVADWMHVKEYTKPELEEMLVSENFKIHKSFWRNNFKHWKQRLASWYRPSLSEEIIIIAQK